MLTLLSKIVKIDRFPRSLLSIQNDCSDTQYAIIQEDYQHEERCGQLEKLSKPH